MDHTQASSRYIESNTNTVTPLLDILNYRPIFSLFGDSNSIPALNCSSYESLSRETDPGLWDPSSLDPLDDIDPTSKWLVPPLVPSVALESAQGSCKAGAAGGSGDAMTGRE